jgi:hypothetical protein
LHTHKKQYGNFSTISFNKISDLTKLRPGESISYLDITNRKKKKQIWKKREKSFFARWLWDWFQYKYSYLYSTTKWQQTIYWLSYDECFCSLKIIAVFLYFTSHCMCRTYKTQKTQQEKIGLMRQLKGGQTLCKLIIKLW